jgi:hypothetical protein
MATELRRRARLLVVLPAALALAFPATARAAQAWWAPLAFAGQRITSVNAAPGEIVVRTGPATYLSTDAGRSFLSVDAARQLTVPPQQGPVSWEIRGGTVFTGRPGRALVPDPRSPFLGDSAHLITAPAASPGVAVAVGTDNHVWRRVPSGQWSTSFIPLPAGGLSGAPPVTSLAAFAQPLTAAVYMGTDGYGVLVSEDGGDDWIRADPGLPGNVLAMATDPSTGALFAATDRGLFVHHLQAFPAPPVYRDASLYWKWLGIVVVALMATTAAVLGLRRALARFDV